jgi:hypothetical protein
MTNITRAARAAMQIPAATLYPASAGNRFAAGYFRTWRGDA